MPILLLNYCCLTISQYSIDVSVTSTDAQNLKSNVIKKEKPILNSSYYQTDFLPHKPQVCQLEERKIRQKIAFNETHVERII